LGLQDVGQLVTINDPLRLRRGISPHSVMAMVTINDPLQVVMFDTWPLADDR
jgi:hypothetical protein